MNELRKHSRTERIKIVIWESKVRTPSKRPNWANHFEILVCITMQSGIV